MEAPIFLLLLVVAFALVFIGVPVAFALGIVSSILVMVFVGIDRISVVSGALYGELASYSLLALPLFILMAALLGRTRVVEHFFSVLSRWLKRMPGSLLLVSNLLGTILAACTGSSAGNTAAMGVTTLPEMLKRGYSKTLAAGVVAASGSLGILIPPSTLFIIYGLATGQSIGKLFLAGAIPGLLISGFFFIYIIIRCWLNPDLAPRAGSTDSGAAKFIAAGMDDSLAEVAHFKKQGLFKDLVQVIPILLLFGFMLYAMYTGLAAPSELGALGVGVVLLLAILDHSASFENLSQAAKETMRTTGMIMWIIIPAMIFSRLITFLNVQNQVVDFLKNAGLSPMLVLICMNLILFVLGMFFDSAAIILIIGPLFAMIAQGLGFDPIWFGVVFVINMELGLLTPPFGMNLYVLRNVSNDLSMLEIIRGVIPFIALLILGLAITIAFPQLALWLPSGVGTY